MTAVSIQRLSELKPALYIQLFAQSGSAAARQKHSSPMKLRFTIRDLLWLTALVAMGRHLAAAPLCKADRV